MRPIIYFQYVFILCSVLLCGGCSTPTTLRNKDVAHINHISVAVSATLTDDVAGFTDSVDVPLSKQLAETLQTQIAQLLVNKGYQVTDHHLSVGKASDTEGFYIIETDSDRTRDLSQLSVKHGVLYSQRLNSEQLQAIHKAVLKEKDTSPLRAMGFHSDATLVALLDGRTIGLGKKVVAYVANTAIIALQVIAVVASGRGGGGGGGGNGDLMQTDDMYAIKLRLFKSDDGELLWKTDINLNRIEDVSVETLKQLQNRIPNK